jgi:radical SAM superfamily enzyme with C-terminal helix-hairpin-helix motif
MVREFFEYRPYISIQQFRQEIGKYVDEAQVATYEQYVYVPVDVNEADAATLMQISGVDQAVADGLIAARPYASAAAFLDKVAELAPTVDRAAAESYLEAK